MAGWSQLPPELLLEIAGRLVARFDVLRFRSVCSSWRSSVPPKRYPSPTHLPKFTQDRVTYYLEYIDINTSYLIRPPDGVYQKTAPASARWLAKVSDATDIFKMRMLNPFSDFDPLSGSFPKVWDLTNFQVFELGHEYIGVCESFVHSRLLQGRFERKKVVFLQSDADDFKMLGFYSIEFGCLAVLRSGEKEWTMLENVKGIHDVISFNGKFYAIVGEGETVVIDQSLNVSFLGPVGFGSAPFRRMFLVKSDDNLLAVEISFLPTSNVDKVYGVTAFRMNEKEKKWETESLRDRILFLNLHQAISAPASEFGWGKGNLVFYPIGMCSRSRRRNYEDKHMFVFDIVTCANSSVEHCPAYRNLLLPSLQWVPAPESVVSSSTQVISSSARSESSAKKLKTST